MPRPGRIASATKCRSREQRAVAGQRGAQPALATTLGRQRLRAADARRRPTAPTPNTASATNTERQPHCPAMTPPSDGANSGATPMTSMSRDISREASAPTNRSRMIAMATTVADALKKPCMVRSAMSGTMAGAIAHSSDVTTCSDDADQHGLASTEPVRQRPDDQLAHGAADEHRRHRQLRGRGRRVQVPRDVRQRRQVDVGGDGRQGAHQPEHQHVLGVRPVLRGGCGVDRRTDPGGTTLAAGAWPVGAEGWCAKLIDRFSHRKRIDSIRAWCDVGGTWQAGPHVWSICLLPRGPGAGRRVRHRDRRRRRPAAGPVLERRPHRRRPHGRRARGQGDRGDHPAAARGPLGPGAVVGQGHLRGQPDDQRARRVARGEVGVRPPVRRAPRAAARRRLLRVEEAGTRRDRPSASSPSTCTPPTGTSWRSPACTSSGRTPPRPTTTPRAGWSAPPSSPARPPTSSPTSTTGSR